MIPLPRRALLGVAAALPLARPVFAQTFPDRPVRVIVPFGPGGVADLTARAVANKLTERLSQPVVVENRPGAGGIVAAQALMSAPADGHALLVASNANAIAPGLFRTLPYDPLRDFAPVVSMGAFAIAVIVRPDSPDRDIAALLQRLRANPGKLNIGTITAGSTQNLSAELFKIRANVQAETIAFPQTPQLVTALLRGDVDVAFEILGPIWGQVQSNAVKVLAVTTARRVDQLPQVPTVQEAGVPDYDVASWNALVARAGTPASIIALLNREVNAVLQNPEVRESLTRVGVTPQGGTAEEFGRLLATETARWREVIDKAGIERQ